MNIAIITGGESGEREVSINSAKNIADLINFGDVETFLFPQERERFVQSKDNFDVAIPMIHGKGGEDGDLQEFLEENQVPYLFSSAHTHRIGIDKIATKKMAQRNGLTVPLDISLQELTFPLFAKPRASGSSLAAELCVTKDELEHLTARFPEEEFILEEPIRGREFTVGIIEHKGQNIPLPVIEIISKTGVFDYESKYDSENLAQEVCPAQIDESLAKELQSAALKIHNELGAKHISRSDFIIKNENQIFFLEINTIPGMTNTSLIPKMIRAQRLSLEDLFRRWVTESMNIKTA